MNTQKSYEKNQKGTLYLVPTPIGNLEDMTYRAARVLAEADLIAAEDTRNTQKLLNHFEIKVPQISFHEHNTMERIPQLVEKLLQGITIAQVSDAGMPSISDPGHELVKACIEAEIAVIPLPGANAGLTALIASGLAPQPFYFYGFLSRNKKTRREELEQINQRTETTILYESPHRIKEVIKAMKEVYGGSRQVVLCRELTKKFEEFIRGSLDEVERWSLEEQIRGEFCILLAGNVAENIVLVDEAWMEWSIEEHLANVIAEGKTSKEAIKEVAKLRNLKKQEVYKIFHEI